MTHAPAAAPSPIRGPRALIADPSPTIAIVLQQHLQRLGIAARHAPDPDVAWRLALTAGPDLLFVDPLLRVRVREGEGPGPTPLLDRLTAASLPVIALPASDSPAPAIAFLRKPPDPALLPDLLAARMPPPPIDADAQRAAWPDAADPLLARVIALYQTEMTCHAAAIAEALDTSTPDRRALARAAHSLKGGASNLAATPLANAAAALEHAAPTDPPGRLRALADHLSWQAARLAVSLPAAPA